MNNNNFWFWISTLANLAQLESYNILLHDFNNHDLMQYLKHQDEMLKKIINQNEELLKLLKGDKDARYKEDDSKNR